MAGVIVGGLWMTAYLKKVETTLPAIIKLELGLVVFLFLLPWIFLKAGLLLGYHWFDYILKIVFLIFSFGSGVLVGAQFPLANKEYLKISPNLSGTAGLLYSADLWGGWLGGILGGVVLPPLLSLMKTSLVVIMFKIS
jgi:spermidine synthase